MARNQEFLNNQEKALLEEKKRLEAKIKDLSKYPDYGYLEEDNIQELTDYENNMSLEEQLQFLLQKVDNAIVSIKAGNYGKCAKCGKEIAEGRLEIMPYADICTECKSKTE